MSALQELLDAQIILQTKVELNTRCTIGRQTQTTAAVVDVDVYIVSAIGLAGIPPPPLFLPSSISYRHRRIVPQLPLSVRLLAHSLITIILSKL